MTIHFETTPTDAGNWLLWYYKNTDDGKRLYRNAVVFLYVLTLTLSAVCWSVVRLPFSYLMVLAGVLSSAIAHVSVRDHLPESCRKSAAKIYSKPENRKHLGQVTLEINEDGLIGISEQATTLYKWDAIHRIETNSEYAFLLLGTIQAIVIPRAAVEDGRFEEFVQEARRLHRLATGSREALPLKAA